MLASAVEIAIQEQMKVRAEHGRCPRIWEILVMQEAITSEKTEAILDQILEAHERPKNTGVGVVPAGDDSSYVEEDGPIKSMVGRVLVDMGAATKVQIVRALELQAAERNDGVWRLLGQILVEEGVTTEEQLRDALTLVEEARAADKD